MKIWVIMMNDYPKAATVTGEEAANQACERLRGEWMDRRAKELGRYPEGVEAGYWRVYEFEDCVLPPGTVIE